MPLEESLASKLTGTRTTCPYCGVGCGVIANPSDDGQAADIQGDPEHPSNFGKLCSKGSALGETLTLEERLLEPELEGSKTDWNSALDRVAGKFLQTIAEHGPDSVAFYVSGQLLTEDYYVANKLMKGFIGSSNIDTNSRLCMASSVAGHKRAFGTDTVPGCYEDLELADLVVLIGSNFAWCHPVLHQRLLAAKIERGTKIVVVDPRDTATTDAADLHLKIKVGGDVALFNALFAYLANSNAYNDTFVTDHTNGLGSALEVASSFSMDEVVEATGLTIENIETFFEWYEETSRTLSIYSQGVNQSSSGTNKVNAIINCHLITGRIGRPGMGPFSITGQPNAMGGREVGGLANQLAVHMDFEPESLDRVKRFWKAPNLTRGPGLKAVDMFDAVHEGKIKALWIMATNPAVSMPNAAKVRDAIEKCPFVVVSDIVENSDTLTLADVKLPATGWGEKSGTVTNSERRISRQRSFLKPPGNTKHDWEIICEVAQRMGFNGFSFQNPSEIFREYAQMSTFENNQSRDFDIGKFSEVSSSEYDQIKPFQWPKTGNAEQDTSAKRFFANGQFFTIDKRANFVPTPVRSAINLIDTEFDLVLNTGRIRDQWHTMTRTGKTQRLSTHIGEPYVEINPKDALRLNLKDADVAVVSSKWGKAYLRAIVTDRVSQGNVFSPIHWTRRYASRACIDEVTSPAHDPTSGQPELKYTPVNIRKMELEWWAYIGTMKEIEPSQLSGAVYWAISRRGDGWAVELAGDTSTGDLSHYLKSLTSKFPDSEIISFENSVSKEFRYSEFNSNQLQAAVFASFNGPVEADRTWIGQNIGKTLSQEERLRVLAGRPPSGQVSGKIVCSCMGVGSGEILRSIQAGANTVAKVGEQTCAGTNCGSCKPEIAAMIKVQSEVSTKMNLEAAE
ncbi:molybdopterin-dependent oxidoreductase [Hirschia litorea]|uniref:Molybdopterin-dependent oxidoreductase n=1 Tax=Hirschia litorea TaxID=1199156 RepID=A0ABW2IHL2_9PROT